MVKIKNLAHAARSDIFFAIKVHQIIQDSQCSQYKDNHGKVNVWSNPRLGRVLSVSIPYFWVPFSAKCFIINCPSSLDRLVAASTALIMVVRSPPFSSV